MRSERARRLLLLSVGYGQGHHSAAAALAEQFGHDGWVSRTVDVCAEAQPVAFRCTQKFYELCVRRAPWLWGVTYSLTDTADWARMVKRPLFAGLLRYTHELLSSWEPDLIICTYPLFAYMLDALKEKGKLKIYDVLNLDKIYQRIHIILDIFKTYKTVQFFNIVAYCLYGKTSSEWKEIPSVPP